MSKLDNIEVLRKLIDEDGIDFIEANKENIDLQLNSFLSMNRQGYVGGIDLAEGEDMTDHTPL